MLGSKKDAEVRTGISSFFALVLLPLLFSCQFGLFNINYPDKSEMQIFIDNELDSTLSKTRLLSFNIDDKNMNDKVLRIEACHKKGNDDVNNGFSFESNSINFTIVDEKSIVVPLSKIKTLGVHEISAKSSLKSKFNKKFIINVTSNIKSLELEYLIDRKNSNLFYDDSDQGILNSNIEYSSPIKFVMNSSYTLRIKTDTLIPTYDITSTKPSFINFEKLSDNLIKMTTKENSKDIEGNINLKIKNSPIEISIPFIIVDIAQIEIYKDEINDSKTNIIFIPDIDFTKNYNINIESASDSNRMLIGYFTKQGNDENLATSISNELKQASLLNNNDYFSLSFNGITKIISITPKKYTIENTKNLYFYLYIYDINENYFGRWRIMIGGNVEKIEIAQREIITKTLTSSFTTANLTPQEDNQKIIWYLSKEIGSGIPAPMKSDKQDNLISFLNKYTDSDMLIINDISYNTNEYSFGYTKGKEHKLFWTTNGESASLYIVAVNLESMNYDVIPFQITADGEIILKSLPAIYNKYAYESFYSGDKKQFENTIKYINFPYGQTYPETYCKGIYGTFTRTFYLPHDKVSNIEIDTINIKSLNITGTAQSKELYTYELLNTDMIGKYVLSITPNWHSLNEKAKTQGIAHPCQNPLGDTDAYGKIFYQYIGLGTINLNAYTANDSPGSNNIKIRIILFYNN